MKTFRELREMIDPPVMLNLRRSAIRTFPHNQNVAVYKNENLGIEVAIPYTQGQLGKHPTKVTGVAEETLDEAKKPEKSKQLKQIKKERTQLKTDVMRHQDRLDDAKERYSWAKSALAGHMKKWGKTITVAEETINELHPRTLVRYIGAAAKDAADQANQVGYKSGLRNPKAGPVSYNDSEMNHREVKRHNGITMAGRSLLKRASKAAVLAATHESMDESVMSSLHTITKTQTPNSIRFRDGSKAMVDHPTAQRIMALYTKVNRENKRKIKGLLNAGPAGLKKVHKFAQEHMK